jgi:hypothetical protein
VSNLAGEVKVEGSDKMTASIQNKIKLPRSKQAFTVLLGFMLLAAIIWSESAVLAQGPALSPLNTLDSSDGATVMFNNHVLFRIYTGAGSESATSRAEKVTGIIKDLAKDPFFHVDSITTRETRDGTDVQ